MKEIKIFRARQDSLIRTNTRRTRLHCLGFPLKIEEVRSKPLLKYLKTTRIDWIIEAMDEQHKARFKEIQDYVSKKRPTRVH